VDHNTCTASWEDPRTAKPRPGAADDADADEAVSAADEADGKGADEGAAADLTVLSLGVVLPHPEEQLGHWMRAVERSAHAALKRATDHQRSAADIAQCPRFMLVQMVHAAVVKRLVVEPARRPEEELNRLVRAFL
jgi:hypothetical protein